MNVNWLQSKCKRFFCIHPSHYPSIRNVFIVIFLMAVGLIVLALAPPVIEAQGLKDYLPLHTALETASLIIAMLVFSVGWNSYGYKLPANIALLSTIFFGVAIFDFSHIISYAGMPDFVTPSGVEKGIDFWLAARVLSSAGLLLFLFLPIQRLSSKIYNYSLLAAVLVLLGLVHWLVLYEHDLFPHMFFIPGQGLTLSKIAAEYVIIALNLIAASILLQRMRTPQPYHAAALFGALCIMAMSEFFFTLYADVTDIYNIAGHIYKTVAYLFVYRAIFVTTVQKPYQELHDSQKQLRIKNQLFDSIIDNIPHMVFLKDASELRFALFNKAGEELLQQNRNDFLGRNDYDFFPKEQADFFIKKDRETLKRHQLVDIPEETIETPKGIRILHTKKLPLLDENGVAQYLLGISEDITDKKAIENALIESEEAFHSTFNQAAVGIAHVSLKGYWLDLNAKFCDIVGYTKEELQKLTFQNITYADDLDNDLSHIQQMLSGTIQTYSTEKRYIHKSGKLIWINLTASLARDNNGDPKYFIKVIEDISSRKQIEEALIESEHSLKESQVIAGIGSYSLNFLTGMWTSTEVLDTLLGIDHSYIRSIEGWAAMIHPDDRERMNHYLNNAVIGERKSFNQEYRIIRHNDRDVRWVHGLGKLEYDDRNNLIRMIGTIQDITERKNSEDTLLKLSMAVEQSPSSIVITDVDGNIEYVNAMFTTITGYSKEEVIGNNPRILKSSKTPMATYDEMWEYLTHGRTWRGELINQRKDTTEYIEYATITPVKQPDGKTTHYLAIKENITEKKQVEAHIENLAHYDQLTGLPNRILLHDRITYLLNHAQRNDEPMAVMFLDLDHFKNINDTLGHTIGDKLLIEIAKRLKTVIRDEDTVSRLGGDEFILLFPDTDSNAAIHIATKLIETVSVSSTIEQHELTITPSIGIAIYPYDGTDFETLLRNADTAMYRAKNVSRNAFHFFTPEMQLHSARNLQLVNALRHALQRNELQLHYQPQISALDGTIIGAEALLRWNHPEMGSISPAEFIPIAEDSGQIIQIGEWVLRTAVHQMKAWKEDGFGPMVIAVNLSAVQFQQANLIEVVTNILEEAQLPHEYLELELTEAATMYNPQGAISIMNRLHELGIRMSIDDFGTGYSSLSYLKQFKVYKLKIDQSFVRDISVDPEDKAIVRAIIDMAKSLGMKTIAEGVESAEQLAFLQRHRCDEIQGYYFSKPLPAEQFAEYFKRTIPFNRQGG